MAVLRSATAQYVGSKQTGGLVILDIDDMTKPKFVSGLDWSPPYPWPTHTALPVPFLVRGRKMMIVADEDVTREENAPPSFLWIVQASIS